MKTLLRAAAVLAVLCLTIGALATSVAATGSQATSVVAFDPANAGDGGTDGNGPDGAGSLPVPASPRPSP
jgi:hypothetical protein